MADWLINYGKAERGIIRDSKGKGFFCFTDCGNRCYSVSAKHFDKAICPKCGKTIIADYELIK